MIDKVIVFNLNKFAKEIAMFKAGPNASREYEEKQEKFECEHEEIYQKFKKRIMKELAVIMPSSEDSITVSEYFLQDKTPEEKKPWRAVRGRGVLSYFWAVYSNMTAQRHEDEGDRFAELCFESGNYFQTEEEALEAAEAVKIVLKQKRREFGLE